MKIFEIIVETLNEALRACDRYEENDRVVKTSWEWDEKTGGYKVTAYGQ